MFDIPKNIVIQDKQFRITDGGDYRMVLDCFSILNDAELNKEERILGCLLIFYEDFTDLLDIYKLDEDVVLQLVEKMYEFFNCGQKDTSTKDSPRLLDWNKDEQLVCSAVNKVASTEIRALPYLHWYTFMGYYMAIGESALSTIISIRYKMVHNKKLEKHEREFKRNNPYYFVWDRQTADQKDAENWVADLWNKKGGK